MYPGQGHPFSKVLRICLLALFATTAGGFSRTVYLDAEGGRDSADGATPATAWKTLEKFNNTEFQPGDRILLKSGQRWSGQMRPKGSGTMTPEKNEPIRIGKYGQGALPRIDGGGLSQDTLLVEDVEHWEIEDLQITNEGKTRAVERTGVRLRSAKLETMRGIILRRLHVHDVNGDLRKSHEGHGIFFESRRGTAFDRILIENCKLERTDRNGICQRGAGPRRSTNVIIRGNFLDDIGGDGIKLWGTNGGLIERNIVRRARARCEDHAAGIWPFACDDTVVQFNEVSGTKGTKDGQGYDADYQCRRTLIQYNYSHQNEGGFILVCSPGNSFNTDSVIRYNLSVHDGLDSARIIQMGGKAENTHFYNNTIVLGPNQKVPLISFNDWDGGNAKNTRFTNNLFLIADGGKATYEFGASTGNQFANNLFVGKHEGLPANVAVTPASPRFSGPLVPSDGIASLKNFRPSLSGKFPRGVVIEGNGERDFFGKPLPKNGPPAIGAAE